MANPFCLIPQYADRFLEKVRSGELSADALVQMTSAERRTAFAAIMGETNAAHVNASFESKLLLKNQQAGIARWIEQAKDISPAIKRDLLARVERMDAVLDPVKGTPFLADLARQRLGFGVTMEEAGKITALAKRVSETRQEVDAGADPMVYGRARVAFGKYTSALKNAADASAEKSARVALDPSQSGATRLQAAGRTVGRVAKSVPGLSKAFVSALDDSALLRQGWKTLFTHPRLWARRAGQSFTHLVDQFGGQEVMDEVNAEIISRPNARNGLYDRMKLAIGVVEDVYPTSLPERIPVVGRFYKASESAFTAFQYQMRADVADAYLDIARKSGLDLNNREQVEAIGRMVNSLTARGHLGRWESVASPLNVTFFSARKLKSDFDFLTAHQLDAGVTPFVRKQAAVNLVKVISGTAAILAVARAVKPESVEWDPRSSDFGKIRIGHTRFDVTGGMASLITLGARLATLSSKSTTTGKVAPLNSDTFGATTGTDLVYNFFEHKLSPAASVVKELLKGKDFAGKPLTIGGELSHLFMPLPVTNAQELFRDPKGAPVVLGILADMLGVSTNTWATPESTNPKVAAEFQRLGLPWRVPATSSTVAGRTFTRTAAAQATFAQSTEARTSGVLGELLASPAYQALSDEERRVVLPSLIAKLHGAASRSAAAQSLRMGQPATRMSPRAQLGASLP